MGTSHGDFTKYPRTPHLFGSTGTDDDKHLGEVESKRFVADESLIVEEKIDGTNVGIQFSDSGEIVLQCRGHLITEGMHPQYDLFKQWTAVKRHVLETQLESRFILFGEWVYARHSIHYRQLTHYFLQFDICDKKQADNLMEGLYLRTEAEGVVTGRAKFVRLDDEFEDRCFITIGDSADARFEVTLAGENFIDFREALSQVVEERGLDQ